MRSVLSPPVERLTLPRHRGTLLCFHHFFGVVGGADGVAPFWIASG